MGIHRFIYLAVVIVSCIWATRAGADVVTDMYEATIPAKSQERQDRDDAIRVALAEVLVRVSGRTQIADSDEFPRIKAALVNATNYAQQFRFRDSAQQPDPTTGTVSQELWVKFDSVVVNKLLRENKIPVWDKNRPATLMWLVSDEHAHRDVISQSTAGMVRTAVDKHSQIRGLPLRLPEMDLTDRNSIQINEVWTNNEVAIRRASQRYPSDAILVGRLLLLPTGQWNVNWSFYHEGRRVDWATAAVSLETAVNLGIDNTAEALSQRFAQLVQGDETVVMVEIKDIHNLADFNRTVKYLRSLSQVKIVDPQQVSAADALFRVTTLGGRLGLARAISLSQVFSAEPVVESNLTLSSLPIVSQQDALKPELIYRLTP